jgi:hypothetical protein
MNGFDTTMIEFCTGFEELLAQNPFGAIEVLNDCQRLFRKPPDEQPLPAFVQENETD